MLWDRWTPARALFGLLVATSLPTLGGQDGDFALHVAPVLQQRCVSCHGPDNQMNGLRVDDPELLVKGSYSGPVIVPGKSGESKLIERVTSTKPGHVMPPAGPKLTPQEVAALRAWIDGGAKFARAAPKQDPAANAQSLHWAFQPVKRPEAPAVQNRAWIRNPIDNFVLAKLESLNFGASGEAPRPVLIRRVTLDLTGLPPTPQEIEAFVNDNRPDAYERLVDRLLASPHYGERWARHWLDLARYADSDGYEKDNARPHAWRWRHWVIDAFNRNLPFDRFTIEQIAGDLLPNAALDQRVATGFHRNTLTNREAGVDRAEARFEQVLDRTNTVGTVWLGLTVGCAQCHNHKFDPISQKEYYELKAFFHNTEEVDLQAPLPGEMGPYLQARPEYYRKRNELLKEYSIPELQPEWERKVVWTMDNPGKETDWDFQVTSMRAMLDGAERIMRAGPERRTQLEADRLTNYFVASHGPEIAKNQDLVAKFKELRPKLKELEESFPAVSLAPAMQEAESPEPAHIHLAGGYKDLGLPVEPGVLAVLPPLPATEKADRLALARWLVDSRNPLTPRVTVNRFWQELFGRGLVRTAEDFGTQGEKPSHPELMDWLAAEFIENGWDVKQLLKTMVTSAVYRQASDARPEIDARDPENTLLARQSRLRLPAEALRDTALASSGLLDTRIGGKSVRPPQPKGVAELSYAGSVKWEESKGPDRYRRGMYILFQRTVPYPMLVTFDAPEASVTCARRRRSNTPLQALNLLNDTVFFEAAQAFAGRVLTEAPTSQPARLDRAFELALARKPQAAERARLLTYLDQQEQLLESEPDSVAKLAPNPMPGVTPLEAAAWVGLSRVLLNLDEFITRE